MTRSQQLDSTKTEVDSQVQKFYQQGGDHACKGEHALASECYTLAIALDPDCLRAYCARGESSLQLKQYDRAEHDFKIALKLNPTLAVAEGGLARTYSGLGNYQAALIASNRAIKRDPGNVDLYYYRALINKKLNDYSHILVDCKFILENQPNNLQARWLNARAHFHLGNYKIALFNFDCYLNLRSDDFYDLSRTNR
jgi:tetratricopeptide (TPR) repeat protein